MRAKQGTHYLVDLMGQGYYIYEWVSKETGNIRKWIGQNHWEFMHWHGDDLTLLPEDYCNTSA